MPAAPDNQDVWAPELHFLNGNWYVYFAADDGNNANHRLYVAEANTADPQGAYTSKGKLYDASNDRWAIDGTVLQMADGSLYCIWSQWAKCRYPNPSQRHNDNKYHGLPKPRSSQHKYLYMAYHDEMAAI